MFRLKISASVIGLWQRGDVDGVFKALHGVWRPANPAMQYGIDKHKEWQSEVEATGHLPKIFGGEKLINPKCEQYYTTDLCDWVRLSGILDLQYGENGEVIVDYKTGSGSANSYAKSIQVGCYALLRPEAKLFRFLCYNQHRNLITSSRVHLDDELREDASDKIMSAACDIRAWLEGLEPDFDNYGRSHKSRK